MIRIPAGRRGAWSPHLAVWLCVDVVAAVALATAMLLSIPESAVAPVAVGAGLALAMCAGVAVRRLVPLPAFVVTAIASAAIGYVGDRKDPMVAMALVLYTTAVRGRATVVLGALLLAEGAVLVADQSPVFSRMPDAAFASTALVQAAAWTIGIAVRTQRAYASGLKEQAEQRVRAETDRSRRALAEERLRIARELHDVIAHTMSVIAVQASVGAHVIDAHPAEGRATLRTIERATHGALHELRSMLNVLRDSDGTTATGISLAPAPSLVDLPALIDQTRQTGLAIEVATVGSPRVLAPSIELATYRIVQEALTNVVRHANAQHARVELAYHRTTLDVTVTDDGNCTLPTQAVDGHGVIGMRERVALHGGQFTAGPDQSRGFRIHAVLPVGGSHEEP